MVVDKHRATIFPSLHPLDGNNGEEGEVMPGTLEAFLIIITILLVIYTTFVRWWNTFEKSGLPSIDKKERGEKEKPISRIFERRNHSSSRKRIRGASMVCVADRKQIVVGRLKRQIESGDSNSSLAGAWNGKRSDETKVERVRNEIGACAHVSWFFF